MPACVLVAGGAGYVGSILARTLLQRRYAVRILDQLYYGDCGVRDLLQDIELVREAMRTVTSSIIFNITSKHYHIIDLAKLIQSSLRALSVEAEITRIDCLSRERGYRVSTEKIQRMRGFKPLASVAATLPTLYTHIRASNVRELDHPIYYNILWMHHLRESLEFQV